MKMVKVYNKDECLDCLKILSDAGVLSKEQDDDIENAIMNLD